MNQTSIAIFLKPPGIGDLCILIANIHAISKSIGKPVVVLAQKSTRASSILKNDPHVREVIELNKNISQAESIIFSVISNLYCN